jgi:transcriptional regulator with XRE-family HTH domain
MTRIAKRVDEYVGERIRQRRTELGLTQEHLASALDISYQQIQKYETGANRVSAGRLFEIAQRLEVDVAYFFDGLEPAAASRPLEHGGKNRAAIEVVRNFAEIDDAGVRSALSGLIKSLAGKSRRRIAA